MNNKSFFAISLGAIVLTTLLTFAEKDRLQPRVSELQTLNEELASIDISNPDQADTVNFVLERAAERREAQINTPLLGLILGAAEDTPYYVERSIKELFQQVGDLKARIKRVEDRLAIGGGTTGGTGGPGSGGGNTGGTGGGGRGNTGGTGGTGGTTGGTGGNVPRAGDKNLNCAQLQKEACEARERSIKTAYCNNFGYGNADTNRDGKSDGANCFTLNQQAQQCGKTCYERVATACSAACQAAFGKQPGTPEQDACQKCKADNDFSTCLAETGCSDIQAQARECLSKQQQGSNFSCLVRSRTATQGSKNVRDQLSRDCGSASFSCEENFANPTAAECQSLCGL